MNRSDEYEKKKQTLIKAFHANKEGLSLQKKSSNLFRYRARNHPKLDVRNLNQVISIDPIHLIAVVEAMITYEDLVAETLKMECLPPVVPELKTITIGGALVGLGIEASSFRYGLVHESILEFEVLTGEGKIVVCRPDNEHRDLFYAFPNSYGTLGYALKIKLQLIPVKPMVRLSHIRFNDFNVFCQKIQELSLKKEVAYLDGVIFNHKEMYLNIGEFCDEARELSDYTYMNIYFQSIREKKVQYLSTQDFIWRWDSDWFWCSKHFGMQNKILRFLFGKLLLRSSVYWQISHFISSNALLRYVRKMFTKPSESVIQDILIPIENGPKFYDFFRQSIGITPIWICPFKAISSDHHYPLFPLDPKPLYLDFGFWDIVPSFQPPGTLNKLIEQKTKELNGYKSLYSDSFYTEEEFWDIHPKGTFVSLKAKYDPQSNLKNLFTKCVNKNN